MRILLLGKDGQVGWELQRALLLLQQEVIVVGHPEMDLADVKNVRSFIRSTKPQIIINAAAYTDVNKAEREPELAFAINGIAPGVLAEEAKAIDAMLIHYSTDYVFDGKKSSPYTEEDLPNPINVYGKSKFMGEQAIQQVNGEYLILRTSWVYSLRKKSFVTNVLAWARQNRDIRIVTDQVSNPTWCRMLAQISAKFLLMACQNGRDWCREYGGLYHLAGSGYASRFELAREILKCVPDNYPLAAKKITPVSTAEFRDLARRPLFSALNTDKFVRSFGIEIPRWEATLQLALADIFIAS
jgi:dTDP-4-dehydrorhamnose reductase